MQQTWAKAFSAQVPSLMNAEGPAEYEITLKKGK